MGSDDESAEVQAARRAHDWALAEWHRASLLYQQQPYAPDMRDQLQWLLEVVKDRGDELSALLAKDAAKQAAREAWNRRATKET